MKNRIEKCPDCCNIVQGTLKRSPTQKIFSTIVKKGGMKVVLTPFGGPLGTVVGTLIDIVAEEQINQIADLIANAIWQEDEIYKFECPKCNRLWQHNYEAWGISDSSIYFKGIGAESEQTDINRDFHLLFESIDNLTRHDDAAGVREQMELLKAKGLKSKSTTAASIYLYLSAFLGLSYGKNFWTTENSKEILKEAKSNIDRAIENRNDDEYKIVAHSIRTLLAESVTQHQELGIIDIQNMNLTDSLLEKDYLNKIYEMCRFSSLWKLADKTDTESEKESLWLISARLNEPVYKMYANMELFKLHMDITKNGKLTDKGETYLVNAYKSPDFSIKNADVKNLFDAQWLSACAYYAYNLMAGTFTTHGQNIQGGINDLKKIAELKECPARDFACSKLAELYEDGKLVNMNLETALLYYDKIGDSKSCDRIKGKIGHTNSGNSKHETKADGYLDAIKKQLSDNEDIKTTATNIFNKFKFGKK